jgi:hypothetical protein
VELSSLLSGLVSGTLTVPAAGWLLQQFPQIKYHRMFAVALSFLLGTGAFLLSGWLGYDPWPAGPAAWTEALWPVWAAAFTASQIVLSGYRTLAAP